MNSLSWFLYFVDISGGIQSFFGILAFFTALMIIGFSIAGGIMRDSSSYRSASDNFNERKNRGIAIHRKVPWLAIPFISFLLIVFIIPSKEALYMIGASEVGEKIVALEEVQSLGGEVGGLAKDTIALLREKIKSSISVEE